MVYTPKPRVFQRIVGSVFGNLLFVFASRLVVATTGGSLAFATNLLWNAGANSAAYAVAIYAFPYAYFDLTILICMLMHDVIFWALRHRGFSVVDAVMYVVYGFNQFWTAMVAYLLIWAFVPESPSHLGIPQVPAGVEDIRAVFGGIIQASVWVFGWFLVSEISGYSFKEARASGPRDPATGRRRYNHTLYMSASMSRALLIGLVRFAVSLGGIPITGGYFNTFGYLGGAIVSWTWTSTWYVNALCPLGGILGFFAFLAAVILPSIPIYRLAFGEDEEQLHAFGRTVEQQTSVPAPFGGPPQSPWAPYEGENAPLPEGASASPYAAGARLRTATAVHTPARATAARGPPSSMTYM